MSRSVEAPVSTWPASESVEGQAPRVVVPSSVAQLPAEIGRDRYTAAHLRDSLYRRLVALADGLAVAIAMAICLQWLGSATLEPLAIAVPILFVVIVKAMGLYDRDEHLLHKTTLDEVPALFGLCGNRRARRLADERAPSSTAP